MSDAALLEALKARGLVFFAVGKPEDPKPEEVPDHVVDDESEDTEFFDPRSGGALKAEGTLSPRVTQSPRETQGL